MEYGSRAEIDERYRWDLESIFESDEAFEEALEKARSLPEKFASFEGKVATSSARLLAFLRLDEDAGVELGKLVNYACRKADEDTRVSKYQAYSSQVMSLYTDVSSASSWFSSELLSISEADMERFYGEEPGLEKYRRMLESEFRMRPHVLSAKEENLLARAGEMARQPDNIYSLLCDADMRFPDAEDFEGQKHPVTHGAYVPLLMSPDRTLRKSAFQSMYSVYGQFRNTCAATLAAQMKQLSFYATARKYDSTLAYCLDANEVPCDVYTNLIEAVHGNLGAMYKYVDLRKRALGLDELHFFDLYVPMVEDVDMHFTYEEACELILKALEPMGEEYLALVRKGLSERWVDVYETPGKRSGGYSAGGYGMHPVVLLNFQGELDDVFTLIHEMGHSIHTYLSCANQPAVYSDYVIFVAEVASTCNEALLTRYLLETTRDGKKRAYVLNHFLEQFRSTIYRQCMFAEFELEVNEMEARGEGVTAEALCEKYRALNELYFGDGVVVDDEIALEWARIPHFYYEYYVYQYSTGFAAAIALSQRILDEGKPAVDDYLGFLEGGSSKPPIELLKDAGVDMSTAEPVNAALRWFDELVDEMADALGL